MQSEVASCHGEGVESTVWLVALGDDRKSSNPNVSVRGSGHPTLVELVERTLGKGRAIHVKPLSAGGTCRLDDKTDQAFTSHEETKDEIVHAVIDHFCPESSRFSNLTVFWSLVREITQGLSERVFCPTEERGKFLLFHCKPPLHFCLLLAAAQPPGKFLVEVAEIGTCISKGDNERIEPLIPVAGLDHDCRKSQHFRAGGQVASFYTCDGCFLSPFTREFAFAGPDCRIKKMIADLRLVERAFRLGEKAPDSIGDGRGRKRQEGLQGEEDHQSRVPAEKKEFCRLRGEFHQRHGKASG